MTDEFEFAKMEFGITGHNDVYERDIIMYLDVIGNVGGILGFVAALLAFFVDPLQEHMFLIKFIKMAFITRE